MIDWITAASRRSIEWVLNDTEGLIKTKFVIDLESMPKALVKDASI